MNKGNKTPLSWHSLVNEMIQYRVCVYLSIYITIIHIVYILHTVFARSDVAATIYFINHFCAVSTSEQRLFHSSKFFCKYMYEGLGVL